MISELGNRTPEIGRRNSELGTQNSKLGGLLAIGLLSAILALVLFGLEKTRSTVTLELDGQRTQVRTHASTVGEVLRQAGLVLYVEDRIAPAGDALLEPETVIHVQRARPVLLSADGDTRQMRSHAATAGELLSQAGLVVGPGDEVWLDGKPVMPETALWDKEPLEARQASARGGLRAAARPPDQASPHVSLRRATAITLDDGGVSRTLHSTASTVGQVLEQHGITLFLGDVVTPGLQELATPGLVVSIRRSVPLRIEVDRRTLHTRTVAGTVAGVLGQEGIALVGKDRVEPGMDEPVRPDMRIRVTRVHDELAVEFDPIPFETVWVADPQTEIDQTRLAQAGQVGLTKHRYRVVYEDGQAASRTLEDTWAEQPPITKTLAYGTKIVIRTLETPDGPIEYWRKMRVYTTSYTAASSGKPRDHPRFGYTRLGWKLTKGIVAVDPTVIPLKTKLYVPGYGLARAGDTGGGVKGKFVDLGFDRENYQSWHWWTDVYLLTPVPPRDQIRWVLPNWPKYPDRRR
jgi:uncharacterized protein YabE (DUF348 family)